MAIILSYTPTSIIDKALFNFDVAGIANFRLYGNVVVSISQPFMLSQYLSGYGYSSYTWSPDVPSIFWNSTQVVNINSMLAMYSNFINLSFSTVYDYTSYSPLGVGIYTNSDINITLIYRTDLNFSGISSINQNSFGYTGSPLDIILNEAGFGSTNYNLNNDTFGFHTLMHEIGHSLGLSHPHSSYSNGTATLTSDYAATVGVGFQQLGFVINSAADMNKEYFSIMSYDDLKPPNSSDTYAQTPMILDTIALIDAYGAGSGTSGYGNDTITPGSLAGVAAYRTYFDLGGTNLVNLMNYVTGVYFNMGVTITGASHLVGVSMSIDDAKRMIAAQDPTSLRWYYGEFQNAFGSIGDDVIIGNYLDNTIDGYLGNDTIDGGGGTNTLVLDCSSSSCTNFVSDSSGLKKTLTSTLGIDTLYNIQFVKFSDKTITVTDLQNQFLPPSSGSINNFLNNLNKLSSSSFAVNDSSVNIASNIDLLQSNASKISSISLTGTLTPISITGTQLTNDAAVLGLINGSYTLNLSGINITSLTSVCANSHVASITISDTSVSIAANLDFLQSSLGKVKGISLQDNAALSLSSSQLGSDATVLALLPSSTQFDITDSSDNIVNNLSTLLTDLIQIKSITLNNPSDYMPLTVSQLGTYSGIFAKFNSTPNISVTDIASHFNGLNLTSYKGDKVALILSSSDSDMTLSGGAVTKVDLTNLTDANFNTKMINSGLDTEIDITANGTTHKMVLQGETLNQVQVVANYTSSINNISQVGLSPDNSTLMIHFKSGETTSLPYYGGSGTVNLGGTTYQTNNLAQQASVVGATNTPIFTDGTGGNTSYLLPTKFTGPVSLGLQWELISNTDNAVVTGSSQNDFIKVASSNSIGKAVNGGGGTDVIDGGVGSTFVSGGGSGATTHSGDTFFLDGRAPGTSWSTITDFKFGSDQATIWGFVKGVSSVDMNPVFSNPNNEGAIGYKGLTLHFDNLLPDGQASGTNLNMNSITLSGHTLADIGVSSLQDLNNQIAHATTPNAYNQYIVNDHILIGQTFDVAGTHGYLFIH